MTDTSYHIAIWMVSVSVKFLALYLVSKVSEKSGIGPPLFKTMLFALLCGPFHSCINYILLEYALHSQIIVINARDIMEIFQEHNR